MFTIFKTQPAAGKVMALLAGLVFSGALHAQVGLYNTGVDDSNTVLTTGAVDTHYTLLGYDSSTTYAVNDAQGYPGYWLAPSTTSKWITPQVADGTASGAYGPTTFVYQTTFDLTGMNPATGSINGMATADNGILSILINGASIGFSSTGYGSFSSFVISSGFQTGINTLQFTVDNWSGPTGLRTEMVGTFERLVVTAVPEPETYAMMLAGLGLIGTIVRRRRQIQARG
jgi:hypothetical protein